MRIAWLCNLRPPVVAEQTGQAAAPFGGWLDDFSRRLLARGDALLCLYPGEGERGQAGALSWQGFAQGRCAGVFQTLLREWKPDIVHIWGTEFDHSLDMLEACAACGVLERAVISLQGIICLYTRHYLAHLPEAVVRRRTPRDWARGNLLAEQRRFAARGERERRALALCRHVIGRTDWDKACAETLAPQAAYHFCSETLRAPFYAGAWRLENAQKHSLFVSQYEMPLKGFHLALEALALVRRDIPDARLYVTGEDLVRLDARRRLRLSSYRKYLRALIFQHDLAENVEFLGVLDAGEMRARYLKSHAFALPSSIENSPNSLGEAMLLGVPCVAADVGGVKNMLAHGKEGFVYQADAPYMLAHYIRQIFADDALALRLSQNARAHALETHDPQRNFTALLAIYGAMAGERIHEPRQ